MQGSLHVWVMAGRVGFVPQLGVVDAPVPAPAGATGAQALADRKPTTKDERFRGGRIERLTAHLLVLKADAGQHALRDRVGSVMLDRRSRSCGSQLAPLNRLEAFEKRPGCRAAMLRRALHDALDDGDLLVRRAASSEVYVRVVQGGLV